MPSKTVLFNTKAVATHTFPIAPRNTITFSPSGRLVLVAGFGNLAGHIDVYDLEKDHAKVCTIQASNSSVCEWSPDGAYLLTATTSPRLRVDNGVKIWHAGGGLVYQVDMSELYHVTWRPRAAADLPFPDPLNPVPAPHTSALAALGAVKTPSKPAGAYRPPGARGTSTPLAFMREDQGGAAFVRGETNPFGSRVNGFGPRSGGRREVPGATPSGPADAGGAPGAAPAADGDENASKAALKNKRKREAKRTREAATTEVGPQDGAQLPTREASSQGNARKDSGSNVAKPPHKGANKPPAPGPGGSGGTSAPSASELVEPATPSPSGGAAVTPHDKKIRALTKKLRAIDDLKMRAAGGEVLEATQIKKMETEDAVRKELESLGWAES